MFPKDIFLGIFTNSHLVFSEQRNKCLLPSNADGTSILLVETTSNLSWRSRPSSFASQWPIATNIHVAHVFTHLCLLFGSGPI